MCTMRHMGTFNVKQFSIVLGIGALVGAERYFQAISGPIAAAIVGSLVLVVGYLQSFAGLPADQVKK